MTEPAQQVLLGAIKASLFGTAFSYPDDTDWDAVIKEATAQTVLGLISPVIPVYDMCSDQFKAHYIRLLHEQDKLLKLLDANQISCVILKGCAAAVYYPKPFLRAMGDVDFLVPHSQFEAAMKLMEANGYIYSHGKGDDGGLAFQSRHIGYYKNGIEFELHHHFSSKGFNMDDILERAIARREYKELCGFRFPVLPETENGLVLLGHINQHLLTDHLGLRQIIDWEMYVQSVLNSEKWETEFAPVADEIGLSELAVNVTEMCRKHLGLSVTLSRNAPAEEDIADKLLESLLTYGNFGRKQPSSQGDSGNRISTVIGDIRNKGLFSYFQKNGLETWKLSKKHPVLKPFAFIYGFFRFLVRGITGIMKTGKYKEQVRFVLQKNSFERDLGIRTKETNFSHHNKKPSK